MKAILRYLVAVFQIYAGNVYTAQKLCLKVRGAIHQLQCGYCTEGNIGVHCKIDGALLEVHRIYRRCMSTVFKNHWL